MHIPKFLNSFINSLPLVAKTGLYSDLSGKPTLGTASALDVGTTANKIIQLNASGQIPSLDASLLLNVISSGASPSVPYSINSAKKDSNGYASFITKISNTEISFDTNSGSTPIIATYPDGGVETNNTLPNITSISTDGTYYVVKEKASNPYVTTLQPLESYTAPTSPSTNRLWLDLSVVPHIPKKWNGSSWIVTQFVKLGQFGRTSGVIGTPISYALNGTYRYTSTTVTINSIYSLNCNIGCNYSVSGYIIDNVQASPTNETVPINNAIYDSSGFGTGTITSQITNNIVKIITSLNGLGSIRGPSTYFPREFTSGTVVLTCKRNF
jgi:hypothetical protein